MARLLTASIVLVLLALPVRAARAQSPSPSGGKLLEPPRARQGYYVALGYHLNVNHNWEDNESWGTWLGTDLTIRLGQMITRRFGMGLQIHSGTTRGEGQQAALGGLALEGQWELVPNFAVRGGAGVDILSLTKQQGPNASTRGTVSTGYFLGFEYSWFFTHRLTGGWAATPTVQIRLLPGDTASALMGTVGVQLAWWSGLPKNQLELPPGEGFKDD